MEAKNNNVIKFPGRQQRDEAAADLSHQPQLILHSHQSTAKRKMPLWLPTGIAVLLVASFVGNHWLNSSTSTPSTEKGRGLASVSDSLSLDRDVNWEHKMAHDLAQRPRREIASIHVGRRPSAEERLRFEDLNSQYAVTMHDGRLAEIVLPSTELAQDQNNSLFYFRNGSEFLSRHRDLMPEGFETPIQITRQVAATGIFESYALMDAQQKKIGEVEVGLDTFGRLISMKVQAAANE